MCAAPMAVAAQSVYSLAHPLAGGEPANLGSLRGKGLLMENENAKNEEILNSLKYVPPGGGFEPNFLLFQKCEVNGAKAHLLFAFLPGRKALPAPSDDPITWSLVCRNDVSWNFEKFLVGPDGVPVRRYSRHFPTIDIEPDIQALLSKGSGGA
ncbi:glutathione peroxidase 1-like [Lepus europaeus]|uniref:glutathione peroxidase 1-like n=1 Tax=Lepus europaeus TaxID=9983 RepID=UPI002B484FA6|nr:glutathione peroxidase 1-like [Lepus europaeus]